MRPPIHSVKHYVQMSRSEVSTVSVNVEQIIKSVPLVDANLVDEVVEGATVKAVFVELWLLDSSNDGSNVVVLTKDPSATPAPTFTNMNALGDYLNKKNILFTHQGLSANNGVGNPIVVLRQWIKIPKSKQRFGLNDRLNLTIANNGLNMLEYCGFFTYKEYT